MQYIRAQVANTGVAPDEIINGGLMEGFGNYGIRKKNGWFMFLVLAVVVVGLTWVGKPLARA
jgi:hypothetical protein